MKILKYKIDISKEKKKELQLSWKVMGTKRIFKGF